MKTENIIKKKSKYEQKLQQYINDTKITLEWDQRDSKHETGTLSHPQKHIQNCHRDFPEWRPMGKNTAMTLPKGKKRQRDRQKKS